MKTIDRKLSTVESVSICIVLYRSILGVNISMLDGILNGGFDFGSIDN